MSKSDKFFSTAGQFVIGGLANIMILYLILTVMAFLPSGFGFGWVSIAAFFGWSVTAPILARRYVGSAIAIGAIVGALASVVVIVMTSEWP